MISIFNGRRRSLGGMDEEEGYAQVSFKMRGYLHLVKGPKLAVFMAIALHSDQDGKAFPSMALLSRETGYIENTIVSTLKELRELTINGHHLLARELRRSKNGSRFGVNTYLIFPTMEEWEAMEQSEDSAEDPITDTNLQVPVGQVSVPQVPVEHVYKYNQGSNNNNQSKQEPTEGEEYIYAPARDEKNSSGYNPYVASICNTDAAIEAQYTTEEDQSHPTPSRQESETPNQNFPLASSLIDAPIPAQSPTTIHGKDFSGFKPKIAIETPKESYKRLDRPVFEKAGVKPPELILEDLQTAKLASPATNPLRYYMQTFARTFNRIPEVGKFVVAAKRLKDLVDRQGAEEYVTRLFRFFNDPGQQSRGYGYQNFLVCFDSYAFDKSLPKTLPGKNVNGTYLRDRRDRKTIEEQLAESDAMIDQLADAGLIEKSEPKTQRGQWKRQ